MTRAKQKIVTGAFKLTMRCVITKVVEVEGCTEEDARTNPWEYAVSEQEVDQRDWDIERVERI